MNIAADGSSANDTLWLNRHIVSNVHFDVLDMTMFFVVCRSDNDILLDYDICAKIDRRHIASHDDLRVHNIFSFHSNILQALQDHVFTNLVLLLSKEIELRFVVLRHRLHLEFIFRFFFISFFLFVCFL